MKDDPKISFNLDDYLVYRIKDTDVIVAIERTPEVLSRINNLLFKWKDFSKIPDSEYLNVSLTSFNDGNNTFELTGLKTKIKMNELFAPFVIKRTSIEEIIKNRKGK